MCLFLLYSLGDRSILVQEKENCNLSFCKIPEKDLCKMHFLLEIRKNCVKRHEFLRILSKNF